MTTQRDFDMTIISHTEPLDINIYADPNYYFQYGKPEFKSLIGIFCHNVHNDTVPVPIKGQNCN